ncbi:MAG: hypothetical protein R3A13_04345 [Bdellovibrionota bacterium]
MFYIPWVKAQNIRFETKDTSEGIQDIQLRKLTQENIATLFASHPEYVKLGLIKLAENLDIICGDLRSEAKVYAEILKLLGGS